jgi:hypothetical protein
MLQSRFNVVAINVNRGTEQIEVIQNAFELAYWFWFYPLNSIFSKYPEGKNITRKLQIRNTESGMGYERVKNQ